MAILTSNSITFIDNSGLEKYLYIRYSNDGQTFTENNGLTPGEWIGICNSNSPVAPTQFSLYTWSKIKGADGTDGADGDTLYTWIKYADDVSGTNMSDSPSGKFYMGISYNNKTEEESTNPQDYEWSLILNKGIEEIVEYYVALPNKDGVTTESKWGWSTSVPSLSSTNKYLWNYESTLFTNGDLDETEPMVIGVYGDSGVGISDIKNYYATTSDVNPPSSWVPEEQGVPALSAEDKYLWNYEEIIYTDGSKKTTTAAIIGAYGDGGKDGSDAVDFQIYSVDGFEFNEGLTSIELKTVAIQCGNIIESGATYQWQWWNKDSSSYENIQDATASTLIVDIENSYAFADIKCQMTYDGTLYEDHVVLTEKTIVYTAAVKFFDGSNIFCENDKYLVAYVELYQNNKKIDDSNKADKYYSGVASVSSDVITSNITGTFSDGERVYFICKNENLYEVVLGEYSSGVWNVVNYEKEYTYTNSLYPTIQSDTVAISKESINKSANIDFIIYKNDIEITRVSVNVIDSNDPIISSTQPNNAVHGQLWLDTSKNPYVLYMYEQADSDVGSWVKCSEKIGGAIFTSQPSSYSEGDLWILGENEACGEFGPGSMLKATVDSDEYSESHWVDADEDSTELKNNIKQYFHFDADTGLRIGQQDENFYVNISSTEMGFYDNSTRQNEKVVNISNNSATIQSAKLKGNTEFYGQINICDPKSDPTDDVVDTLFIWKVEQNGSLSLALAT